MKKYKSITNSMRAVILTNKECLKNIKYNKSLLKKGLVNKGGRNNTGSISCYTKGSKKKNKFIYLNNKIFNLYLPGKIINILYDPNRSSFISLLMYRNLTFCYVLSTSNTFIGDLLFNYNSSFFDHKNGNSNYLIHLVEGTLLHSLQKIPSKHSVYIKSAGVYGILLKKFHKIKKILVKLPSKTLILCSFFCYATIGIVSNHYYKKISIGKAGRNRWLGLKSKVRGVAMNPVDHPHGGGEGKKSQKASPCNFLGKSLKWHPKKMISI